MNVLEMHNIHKSFVGVPVLKGVDLAVKQGEVHALLGENGAGKSTLMNILAGVHSADDGQVIFDGNDITNCTIAESEEAGVAFVHQELNLFDDLKVFENIFFNKELVTKTGRLRKREMIQNCEDVFQDLGVVIDSTVTVDCLSASEKQLLEIAKAIFFEAKLLILDEPTTALSNEEIDHLFDLINKLKSEGKSFVFISHKMPEIFRISDSYTVLRNGEFIQTGKISDVSAQELTSVMVGSLFSTAEIYKPRKMGNDILSVQNVSGPGFENVSLNIKKGEIVGITGLQGSGTSEFLRSVFGELPIFEGDVYVDGKKFSHINIRNAMRKRIALLPANRRENSVIPDMSILENMYISEHEISRKNPIIRMDHELEKYEIQKQRLDIKALTPHNLILSLSGGNQQKVFFARWLNTDADILLLDNPTQGIDVGAKAEIYKLILQLAEEGKTILVNTQEIPELQRIADRCAVFYSGKIVKILSHDEITEHTVMQYATNAIEVEEAKPV
ncbi:MAG TPA: sugar ABC transporter ATP-binding protein [Clostridiaceae bacterium]|nr:sugar ABC transporter ATP-binding protein [Clostridiaceae bacterium]